jgi:cytochrome c553
MNCVCRFGSFVASMNAGHLARALAVAALWAGAWLSLPVHASDVQGNSAAGAQKNAMCIGCHGIADFKTGFPNVHRVPMLFGQNAKYIAVALGEYKRGERKHPSMRAIADTLSEQDMADLGAFFESAGPRKIDPPPSGGTEPAVALISRGGCQSCHGINFNKPIDPAFPKLAGQHADYLFYALKAYQTNDKAFIGRGNPIMQAMVKQFSADELQTLAAYLEHLPGDVVTVQRSRFR